MLRQLVEREGEFALLVGGVVLVEDSLRDGLVDLLDGSLVRRGRFFLVAGCEGGVVLLHDGTHLVLEHLVLEGLRLDYFYALFRGLHVGHSFSPILYFLRSSRRPSESAFGERPIGFRA